MLSEENFETLSPTIPALQDMLKQILQAQGKWYQMKTQNIRNIQGTSKVKVYCLSYRPSWEL